MCTDQVRGSDGAAPNHPHEEPADSARGTDGCQSPDPEIYWAEEWMVRLDPSAAPADPTAGSPRNIGGERSLSLHWIALAGSGAWISHIGESCFLVSVPCGPDRVLGSCRSASSKAVRCSQHFFRPGHREVIRGNKKVRPPVEAGRSDSGSDGRRSRDLSIFSRTLYQLSYRAVHPAR